MSSPEEPIEKQDDLVPLPVYADLIDEGISIRNGYADLDERNKKIIEDTRRLSQSVREGNSTGDMAVDIFLAEQGEFIWTSDDLVADVQAIRNVLEYLKDRSGQPIIVGTVNKSVTKSAFDMKFGFANDQKIVIEPRPGEISIPTVTIFKMCDEAKFKHGKFIDPVLEPIDEDEGSLLRLRNLSKKQTTFEPDAKYDHLNFVLAGEDVVRFIEFMDNESGKLMLQYFRMATLSGIEMDVPEKALEAYRRMCVEFSSELIAKAAQIRPEHTDLDILKAKSLGFTSVEAATDFGYYFSRGVREKPLGGRVPEIQLNNDESTKQ